jgi:hypothetical protein
MRYIKTSDLEETKIWASHFRKKLDKEHGFEVSYAEKSYMYNDRYIVFRGGDKEYDGYTDVCYVQPLNLEGPPAPAVAENTRRGRSASSRARPESSSTARTQHVYGYQLMPIMVGGKKKKHRFVRGRRIELNEPNSNYYVSTRTHSTRVLMLDDFKSLEALSLKLASMMGPKSKFKIEANEEVDLIGFIVEGYHFNKKDAKVLPYKAFETDGKVVIQFNNILIVKDNTYGRETCERFRKSFPIDEAKFLIAMKDHFLTRVGKTSKEKVQQLADLKEQIIDLQKEVGELKFIETSVKNSSNDHFTGMIQRIRALPSISSVVFTKLGLSIITNDLYVEPEEGSKFYVGVYEIVIEITDKFRAKFRNLEAPMMTGGYGTTKKAVSNPHGSCHGSHFGVMLSAIQSLDYFTFVLAAIERLQSVNPNEQSTRVLIHKGYTEEKPSQENLEVMTNYTSLLDDEDETDEDAEYPEDIDEDDDSSDDDEEDDEDDMADDDDGMEDEEEEEGDEEDDDDDDDRPMKKAKK